MGIDVKIGTTPKWNAIDYSVTEDATPIDPSDLGGGVGQFTLDLPETTDVKLARNKAITLSDGAQGTTVGTARGLGGNGVVATLTVDSRMARLNVTRTAQPYSGTLSGAFTYYLGLVGVTTGIVVDTTIATRPVTFPGWQAVVWDQVKKLMAAVGVETSLVADNIVLRPLRGRIAQNYRDTAESWSIDDTSRAQSVEINYYQSVAKTNALAYPLGGWTSDVQAYQVDAGQVATFDISLEPDNEHSLGASLTSIAQPVCVASVDRYYSTSSVYTVSGNDGLPIPPAQWLADGGSVTAAINDDTRSITVTIRGGKSSQYAPYTIGMSSGDNTFYSSLRIVGTGVFYNRQTLALQTGNSADVAPTVIGATVDNEFINTYGDAFRAGLWTLARYTGPEQTISVSTTGINRRGDTGSYAYMTFGQANVDPDFAGKKFGQINTAFAGLTMAQFSALQFAKVQNNFENQAFGNVAGARVFSDGSWYRIRSVSSITPESVSYSGEQDNIMSDATASYAGMTMGQINALHAGKTFADFNARPLIK